MTNIFVLRGLKLVHSLIVVFCLLTPFFGNNYFLFLHAILIPLIVFHWLVNQSTCSLTITERIMRKQLFGSSDSDDCISCKAIQPIYDFVMNNKSQKIPIYSIIIGLWGITIARLIYKYQTGEITKLTDIFIN